MHGGNGGAGNWGRGDAAMLFVPPLPPVLVPRTRALILGRSSACDLPVPSRAASRRHASVEFDRRGDLVIEDLGSKNGTWVNGRRITGVQSLQPGDRVEIGSVKVNYCRIVDQFDVIGDADDTVALTPEAPQPAEEALSGDLDYIPMHGVFQMLENQGQTGLLQVTTKDAIYQFWVVDGHPAHAETPEQSGIEAALEILGLKSGEFAFEQNRPPPARTLVLPLTELLLECSRRDDEGKRRGLGRLLRG